MSVAGIGSQYTYLYNAQTNRLATKDGTEDAFVRYFNGESSEDEKEELNRYHTSMKNDIKSMIQVFRSGVQGANIFQKEDEPFEISAEIVDSEEGRYTVNNKHTFTVYAGSTTYESGDGKIQSSDTEDVETLLAEKTSYTRQMKDGSRQSYLTFYEKDKIRCVREDKESFDWELPLDDESQYDRIMQFLNEFEDKDNLPFTYHKNFWQDFLSGELDVEGFKRFLSTEVEEKGAHCLQITEDGMCTDRETAKYWAYMDPPEFVDTIFRTTEEFRDWLAAEAKRAQEEWEETHLSWVEQFNQDHPNQAGKKCFYWRGVWYTAEEIDALWKEQISKLFTQTSEDALRS